MFAEQMIGQKLITKQTGGGGIVCNSVIFLFFFPKRKKKKNKNKNKNK